jgi:hypothetical protein
MNIAGGKIIFYVQWTEYEKGWGQRPDGFTYAITKEQLATEIKRQATYDTPEEFSRPSEVRQGIVTDELYETINKTSAGVRNVAHHDAGFLGQFAPART